MAERAISLADHGHVALRFRRAVETPEHAADEGRLQIGERPVDPYRQRGTALPGSSAATACLDRIAQQ